MPTPLLLIMGLGAQMIHWDDAFCEQLAVHGFRVIRFDNRDIGKSSHLTGGKRLTPLELLKLRFLRIPVAATYKLIDMAKDTVGLMDALGIKSAHLVGASMGGMIAQEVTLSFPERVRSLTSIMSTTGNPRVPPPTREASAMLMAPPPRSKEEFIVRFGETWKVLRAGSFPGRGSARPRSCRARLRTRPQSGRRRPAAPRRTRLRQPQGAAAWRENTDAGHSRHRRSAGAARRRQGHRRVDSRRKAIDDRRHGPCAADALLARHHPRHRQTRSWGGGAGGVDATGLLAVTM
ncbi:pimeloyl-ACP methyl ester carboxylesterase [Bradyrhizobium sp. i1.3.1]